MTCSALNSTEAVISSPALNSLNRLHRTIGITSHPRPAGP
jgi:hypothetical protein